MTHTLTTGQLRKFVEAMGDGSTWPKHTDDPMVNHTVDCIVADPGEEPTYDEKIYAEEIEAFRNIPQRERVVTD